jgi:hypothetical protein
LTSANPGFSAPKETNMTLNDVVIHVDEALDEAGRRGLEDRLRDTAGVIAPRFNERTPHLVVVAYDADRIHAHDLLDCVRRHGCNGQLIGGFGL